MWKTEVDTYSDGFADTAARAQARSTIKRYGFYLTS